MRITPVMDRIEPKISPEPNSGCWLWTGCLTSNGYAMTGLAPGSAKRFGLVHRLVYEHYIGPIPEGLDLDHLCRVRSCVNPLHLQPVTRSENVRRGLAPSLAKNRADAMTHCKNGHPRNAENTYFKTGTNHRICRLCMRDFSKAYELTRVRRKRA